LKSVKSEESFVAVFDEAELSDGEPHVCKVDDEEICVIKLEDKYYAFNNICTHIGGRLSLGTVLPGGRISCPEHRAVYRMSDGVSLYFPRRGLNVYPVKVEGGKVKLGKPLPPAWREPLPSFKPSWWKVEGERQI
jgi:nitrite reductase/ring-hydroxylating ferredoxin subunit